ncbi:hypothetical protein [Ralstonia solanacearum]|uniref:hypothetical protein n=1 Tax=Ralstonia solanacearum TaxID=305 RepID=UPI0011D2B159|nr:hypothetical protein [Ralstonia solanacearum]
MVQETNIRLEPRELERILQAMQRLVQAGNHLVLVEQQPFRMVAGERLIQLGPGPREGGAPLFFKERPASSGGRKPERGLLSGRHPWPMEPLEPPTVPNKPALCSRAGKQTWELRSSSFKVGCSRGLGLESTLSKGSSALGLFKGQRSGLLVVGAKKKVFFKPMKKLFTKIGL